MFATAEVKNSRSKRHKFLILYILILSIFGLLVLTLILVGMKGKRGKQVSVWISNVSWQAQRFINDLTPFKSQEEKTKKRLNLAIRYRKGIFTPEYEVKGEIHRYKYGLVGTVEQVLQDAIIIGFKENRTMVYWDEKTTCQTNTIEYVYDDTPETSLIDCRGVEKGDRIDVYSNQVRNDGVIATDIIRLKLSMRESDEK